MVLKTSSFTYGPVGDGDSGYLTVGAENAYGNSGQNWYVDGTGTLVTADDEVRVEDPFPANQARPTLSLTPPRAQNPVYGPTALS